MKLILTRPDTSALQVSVTCDGQQSHNFDLSALLQNKKNGLPHPLADPVTYGKALSAALFPPNSRAQQALAAKPKRILLVAADDVLDALPWEYAYGPAGSLACACSFVRGLPEEQRVAPPSTLSGLHIVAVASSPLSKSLAPLNIQGEWTRLSEIVSELERAVKLERAWPPTIEQVRVLVAGQQQRVVHFMGHGGQNRQGEAVLCFEQDNGAREDITASEFVKRVEGSVLLVTLNACESATPGETGFGNLAKALVREHVPYALGMRFFVHDDDALAFSRAFYSDLARGVSIEDALRQARLTLARSERAWAAGNLVLYTSLTEPTPGSVVAVGEPEVRDPQEEALRGIISVLPEVQGAFQGRVDEQIQLGNWLTGDRRPRIMAIHGAGGQGKTALARVAAERFAHAWPGGVWAITLETVPTRTIVVLSLARFLGLPIQENVDAAEIEKQVLLRLRRRRTLLVLDNMETLDEATRAGDADAQNLIAFIQQLLSERTGMLYTSRHLFGWSGEQYLELPGLAPDDGAALFQQSAPERAAEIDGKLARQLSQRVDGHPLGLFLLGKAFNDSSLSLAAFLDDYEKFLLSAENRFVEGDHRQRKMYANFDYSVKWLPGELRKALSQLWVFHAPFLSAVAVTVLDPQHDADTTEASPVEGHLYALWQRGLLRREPMTMGENGRYLYRLPPVMRPYVERYLADEQEREELLRRFGEAMVGLARTVYHDLVRGRAVAMLALECYDDLERGVTYVEGTEQGPYLLYWGWIVYWLGDQQAAIALTERALEMAEGQDRALEGRALHNLAMISSATGHPYEALRLDEQALRILGEVGDRGGEGTTLNNLGGVYDALGNKQEALKYYEQALRILGEVGDRGGEGTTLNNLGRVYDALGNKQEALKYYEQALRIRREVGDRAGEAVTLVNMAVLLYQSMQRTQEAISQMEQALDILRNTGLPQDAAGQTREMIEHALQAMQDGTFGQGPTNSSSTMPDEHISTIVNNTLAVMTSMPQRRAEWREIIAQEWQDAKSRGSDWQIEVEFYTALLAILDGQSPSLPADHPYAAAVAAIENRVAHGGLEADDAEGDDVPEEMQALVAFVQASIVALRTHSPQEKMAFMQQLVAMQADVQDDEMKALLQAIQLALLGGDLTHLGDKLTGLTLQVWNLIVAGVQQDDNAFS